MYDDILNSLLREGTEQEFTVVVTKRVVFSHTFKITAPNAAAAKKEALALTKDYGDSSADVETTEWKVVSVK